MLFKHGHLENELREHGRSASAEIVSITTLGTGASMGWMFSDDSDITTNWFLCRLTVRVTPPGEPAFEKTVNSRLNTMKQKGGEVPVLYDPDDHDRLVVDYKADAQLRMDAQEAADRGIKEWEERYGKDGNKGEDDHASTGRHHHGAGSASAGTPAATGSDVRMDRLQQLSDLRDHGALTDAQFAEATKKILSQG